MNNDPRTPRACVTELIRIRHEALRRLDTSNRNHLHPAPAQRWTSLLQRPLPLRPMRGARQRAAIETLDNERTDHEWNCITTNAEGIRHDSQPARHHPEQKPAHLETNVNGVPNAPSLTELIKKQRAAK